MCTNDLQCHVPALPLFAPLLDRMTTDDITNRFTAFQALSFCRFIHSLTPMELDEQLPARPKPSDINTRHIVWEPLPANSVIKWSIGGQGWVRVFALSFAFVD